MSRAVERVEKGAGEGELRSRRMEDGLMDGKREGRRSEAG